MDTYALKEFLRNAIIIGETVVRCVKKYIFYKGFNKI